MITSLPSVPVNSKDTVSKLCVLILEEHFGPQAQELGKILLEKGAQSFRSLAQKCSFPAAELKNVLVVLLQHRVLDWMEEKGITTYWLLRDNVLLRLRYPSYIRWAEKWAEEGVLSNAKLTKELITHLILEGAATTQDLLNSTSSSGSSALLKVNPETEKKEKESALFELVSKYFLTSLLELPDDLLSKKSTGDALADLSTTAAAESEDLTNPAVLALLSSTRKRKKRSATPKKGATGAAAKGLPNCVWALNHHRFHFFYALGCMVEFIKEKIDSRAATIIEVAIELWNPLARANFKNITVSEVLETAKLHELLKKPAKKKEQKSSMGFLAALSSVASSSRSEAPAPRLDIAPQILLDYLNLMNATKVPIVLITDNDIKGNPLAFRISTVPLLVSFTCFFLITFSPMFTLSV